MKVPGAERAVVSPEKVHGYLLSATHPVGRFKAAYFAALGYGPGDWADLRDALLAIVNTEAASPGRATSYGVKYEVRAKLRGPRGRSATLVTVWIVLTGEESPRFVTAFPD